MNNKTNINYIIWGESYNSVNWLAIMKEIEHKASPSVNEKIWEKMHSRRHLGLISSIVAIVSENTTRNKERT
jgi:hypothetical protein